MQSGITGAGPLADRRVGEDVATLTPHRPGRADFPHPVLRERDSLTAGCDTIHHSPVEESILASSAIHCRFVDRFAGFIVPSRVSRQWLSPRDASLSSFGSRRARFPALSGTMKALRLPIRVSMVAYWFASTAHAIPPAFVFRRGAPARSEVPLRARAFAGAGSPISGLL